MMLRALKSGIFSDIQEKTVSLDTIWSTYAKRETQSSSYFLFDDNFDTMTSNRVFHCHLWYGEAMPNRIQISCIRIEPARLFGTRNVLSKSTTVKNYITGIRVYLIHKHKFKFDYKFSWTNLLGSLCTIGLNDKFRTIVTIFLFLLFGISPVTKNKKNLFIDILRNNNNNR